MTVPIHILLAEDCRFAARAFRRHLRDWDRPFTLTIATDGEVACNIVTAADPLPDIAVLDLKMPKYSGIEVLRRIRASVRLADLPCIVLTTSDSPFDKSECDALGADAYLLKSASGESVIAAIEQSLAPPERMHDPAARH